MASSKVSIKNRRATFEYELLDEIVVGMQLMGSEIKSIRNSKASISEAYCVIHKDELFIRNMQVEPYENSGHFGHEPKRDRKLLAKRNEIDKWKRKLKDQGMTIVPLELFISENGYAKLKIALGRGKKIHDKRESLKTKEMKRDMDRHA
jgi:SsrA-binding protein